MAARSGPLSAEDWKKLDQALASCREARVMIDKAERCGTDCRAHRAMCDAIEARARALLTEFGPKRPRE